MRFRLNRFVILIAIAAVAGCDATKFEIAENDPAGHDANVNYDDFEIDIPDSFAGEFNPDGLEIGTQVGNLAQDIVGADLDGNEFKLSDYRGRVVMLDFWGDW